MRTIAHVAGSQRRPVGILLVPATAVPPGTVWLGSRERRILETLNIPKRHAEWRLGRYAAKCAAATWLGRPADPIALAALEVLADETGAPQLHCGGTIPLALSLSHRAGWALAAVAPPDVALGCDLEVVEARSEVFVADYFTASERAHVAAGGPLDVARRTTLTWCAKECALKALAEGLRLDTRSVECVNWTGMPRESWRPVAAQVVPRGRTFAGWWRRHGALLACVLGAPEVEPPLPLA